MAPRSSEFRSTHDRLSRVQRNARVPFPLASLALGLSVVTGLIAGCQPPTPEQTPAAPTPRGSASIRISSDPWVLTQEGWDPESRGAYLGNGYLGQRFLDSGTGRRPRNPENAYLAGLYENESVAPLPVLLPLELEANGKTFGEDPAQLKGFRQDLRLREGILTTRATWTAGSGEADVEIETALLRQQPDVALLRLKLNNRTGAPIRVRTHETGTPGAGVTYTTRLRALEPADFPAAENVNNLEYVVSPAQAVQFALVTHVKGGPVKLKNALATLPQISAAQVDQWLEGHRRAWDQLWERDIEIEGDAEAQQVVRACLFQLLASLREENTAGVPPMGLSANAFNGHVFWDMDSWMLPALLPQHPELARAMAEYRFRTLDGARANARAEGLPGASFAWESAATGKETLHNAVFRHGRHVSGDVALALKQYYQATGDKTWLRERAWPILKATADNWVARAKQDGKGGFVIRQVTTPDENAGRVDHSAWTQHVARVNLEFATETAQTVGQTADPRWSRVAKGLNFLRDPQTDMILSYAGFTEKNKSKQADALLLAHPGEARLSETELGKLYDFYAPRVIDTGPAMTDAIHAIAAARLGREDEALKRFRQSYQPFVRPPFLVFSEKRTRDNLCFLTGAAGVVEAVLYGFGGLHPEAGEGDKPRLEPHLPQEWKSLRIRRLQWRGKTWDVELKPGAAPVWTPS